MPPVVVNLLWAVCFAVVVYVIAGLFIPGNVPAVMALLTFVLILLGASRGAHRV